MCITGDLRPETTRSGAATDIEALVDGERSAER